MIEVTDVMKRFGTAVVLEVEQLSLEAGHCALAGPNGAGKTTLLLLLAGLEHPTRGSIRIGGHAAGSLGARKRVTFVPDQPALFDDLTVADQMAYVARLHGLDEPPPLAWECVEALRAEALTSRFPRGMSKGQRQASGLLVAVSRPFEVLLLDEPTTGLDAKARAGLLDVLGALVQGGSTIVSSTHDDDLLASAGRVFQLEAPSQVSEDSG